MRTIEDVLRERNTIEEEMIPVNDKECLAESTIQVEIEGSGPFNSAFDLITKAKEFNLKADKKPFSRLPIYILSGSAEDIRSFKDVYSTALFGSLNETLDR